MKERWKRIKGYDKLGIPDCDISSVLHGRINSTHGWCFEVVEDE